MVKIDRKGRIKITNKPLFVKLKITNEVQRISEFKKILFMSTCVITYKFKSMYKKIKRKSSGKIESELRTKVKRKHKYRCGICGTIYKKNQWKLTIHHIQPVSLGGESDLNNLMPLCKKCHHRLHEMLLHINNYLKEAKKIKNHFKKDAEYFLKKIIKKIFYYIKFFFEKKSYKKIFKRKPLKI